MEKLFHFDTEGGPYRADAAVVWCFDDRFTLAVQKVLKRSGLARLDSIRVAGGAKGLASPREESERTFLLEQLRLSRKLHGTDRVILVAHSDCGAYGGLEAFGRDPQTEAEHHRVELTQAAERVRETFDGIRIECWFADFTGVWRIETARSAGGD